MCKSLQDKNVDPIDLDICTYVSLNNEITIKDIAEGLDRAFRNHPRLKDETQEFDAIVHSTGMLVIRSWLTNYSVLVSENARLKRLKHLIGLAPATWGSPQAHKGRTWLGALVKGNRELGPDFMNAGDRVLDGLELGSWFTWNLAHKDLLGPKAYYCKGPDTPFVCVFIGNKPYSGLSSVANDPGTDGTVRWAGCGLNTRKVTIDLTRTPIGVDGKPARRVSISPWADDRLNIPMIAVDGRNHTSLISDPEPQMVQLIAEFLTIGDDGGSTYDAWLEKAQDYRKAGIAPMLTNPGREAGGLEGDFKDFFGHLAGEPDHSMEGWQQFVVHAKDERGDPVTDYMLEILRQGEDGEWTPFPEMYTDVHAYSTDTSYRCFHIRLPKGISQSNVPLRFRINASTGTELMVYQGYGANNDGKELQAQAEPVELDLTGMDSENGTLFYPFTTTLLEIVLNREPFPFNQESRILRFLTPDANSAT